MIHDCTSPPARGPRGVTDGVHPGQASSWWCRALNTLASPNHAGISQSRAVHRGEPPAGFHSAQFRAGFGRLSSEDVEVWSPVHDQKILVADLVALTRFPTATMIVGYARVARTAAASTLRLPALPTSLKGTQSRYGARRSFDGLRWWSGPMAEPWSVSVVGPVPILGLFALPAHVEGDSGDDHDGDDRDRPSGRVHAVTPSCAGSVSGLLVVHEGHDVGRELFAGVGSGNGVHSLPPFDGHPPVLRGAAGPASGQLAGGHRAHRRHDGRIEVPGRESDRNLTRPHGPLPWTGLMQISLPGCAARATRRCNRWTRARRAAGR
jgi:hypothetical protein